jgi:hypothetical protein
MKTLAFLLLLVGQANGQTGTPENWIIARTGAIYSCSFHIGKDWHECTAADFKAFGLAPAAQPAPHTTKHCPEPVAGTYPCDDAPPRPAQTPAKPKEVMPNE